MDEATRRRDGGLAEERQRSAGGHETEAGGETDTGHFIAGIGWGPSSQAVTASLRRLAARGLVERARHSRTCWTVRSGSRS